MRKGITTLGLIPVRATANERSEQVTQLMFGESYEIMHKRGNWLYIRSLEDNYEGWVDALMSMEDSREEIPEQIVLQRLISTVEFPDGSTGLVPAGSKIPKPDGQGRFWLGNKQFILKDKQDKPCTHITETGKKFLNSSYLWGGKTAFGIDCSGFTQVVFRMHNAAIPRDASLQAEIGETICFRHDARPGDIAFFENNQGKIIHTGIILDEKHIIHASGRVRIDLLDHSGIFNTETRNYSHTLSVIKRIEIG
ncbi:MAG: NlpC/P60 family protein [Bacteroidales bacterium]